HLLIPEVGLEGQERLARARVLVVGAGGLGSPVLAYLAAAGVGRIGVIDDDVVDLTNLQRQILYATDDIGKPKALTAAEKLHALNPQIAIDALEVRFDARNARELVRLYDVVVDGTDSFSTRYLLNDACVLEKRPDVYGSIFRFDGQVSVFATPGGPCYRCLYPEPPPALSVPTCAEGGVLGVLPGIVGTWQASEVLKLLLGIGTPLIGRLLLIDALDARVREVRIARDPACPLCSDQPTITDALEMAAPDRGSDVVEVEPSELDTLLASDTRARLLDVREPHEAVLGSVDGAIAMPATQLEARMHELDSARRYVVACRVGAKSLWAVRRLRDAGFTRLQHLRGGLLAYAAQRADFDFF
ncbi:MAG: molybdopterin-synthase adenylyltransferase MoeB, partial [Candidatus Eremiobacteraeota bacterium]|nr:molybdopterin-synthase adenylyltransferase MoeB [Candidatus Eremiobacteraeota bacterium]